MTFEEAALLPRSEKVTLVTMLAEKKAKIFTSYAGFVYFYSVDSFVDLVKQDGESLLSVATIGALIEGSFYYSILEKKVYVHLNDNLNPLDSNVALVYKFHFSNAPIVLPHDLLIGEPIEWLPYLDAIGSVGQQLDDESTGIVLESSSSVRLINSDGFFDEIFDTLLWENKSVDFYSWFPITPILEKRKIFEGVVETKDFAPDFVNFKVKDFVYRLRDFVKLPVFSALDGKFSPSLLDTPKRRIYGQVKQVKCAGVDNVLDGIALSGTVTVLAEQLTLNGTGTFFLSQVAPGDEFIFTINNEEIKLGVESVNSDIEITLNKAPEFSIINKTVKNNPTSAYRSKNRSWHIAGHKLRSPIATITAVISTNRFEVDSTLDIFAGDRILIGTDLISVRRISGNEIITQSAVSPLPIVSDTLTKLPIQNVYFGSRELIYDRDWTYQNTTDAIIQIEDLAEFNITQEQSLGVSVQFTNSSRSITTSAVADFRSILKSNDWIKKNSIVTGQGEWYEILEVKEQEIILREPYLGSTLLTTALIKKVDYIVDDSLITCNCLGLEVAGAWIKTPADAVRHLILNDALFGSVVEESFTQSNADCDYIVSLVIPELLEGEPPSIRNVITKINESVFGSLYGDSSLSISYSILNSRKPESSEVITDTDILSFSSDSTTDIANNIIVNYRPFVDFFTGNDTFETIRYNSGFVDNTSQIKATNERTIYLYEDDKAEIIAQRIALFRSMSNTKVTIKGKMNLFLKVVNDKIFLSLDRLYKRLGGLDRLKIGVVTGVKRSQTETELTISDLGNIFNRVQSIAPNTVSDYSLSGQEDKARWGYILDNQTETPNASTEEGLGNNVIG
jgi:hypothetical protein